MAAEIYFKIDGNYYPLPPGWETVTLSRTFDGRVLRTQLSGSLNVKDSLYNVFTDALDTDPCVSADLEFTYTCPPINKEQLLKAGRLRLSEAKEDCTECTLTIPVRDFSRLESIDPSADVCVAGFNDMPLFQVESGADIPDSLTGLSTYTTKVIPVLNLLKNITDFFDSGTGVVTSDFFGAAGDIMSLHVHQIQMPAFLNGDTVTISLVNEFGTQIHGSVDVIGYTATQLAEKLRNTLLYVPYIRFGIPGKLSREEIAHRISYINLVGSDLVIYTDYEVSSLEIKVNGIVQPGLVAENQAYQYGMKNLVVTAKSLSSTNEICTTWQNLNDALYSLFNTVVDDQGSDLRVDRYETIFPIAATSSSPDIQDKRLTKGYDGSWMKQKVQFGNTFKIASQQGSEDAWEWLKYAYVLPSKQPFTVQPLPLAGVISIQGQICIQNIGPGNHIGVGIDLYLNGGLVANGLGLPDFFVGTTAIIDFPTLLAEGATTNEFCIAAGATLEWRFVGGVVPTGLQLCAQQPKNEWRVEYELPCIDSPSVNEQTPDESYNTLSDFENCPGVLDKRVQGQYYSGLGYAISQQAQGLASYDDTNFFIESDDGYNPKKYTREFYFADNEGLCSTCWEDKTTKIYYYNMLLQKPHIIRNFRSAIPSDVKLDIFIFNNKVDQAGVYTTNITKNQTGTQFKEHSRFKTYEGEIRQTADSFLTRETENIASFSGCGLTGHEGQILAMDYNIRTGIGTIKLISE